MQPRLVRTEETAAPIVPAETMAIHGPEEIEEVILEGSGSTGDGVEAKLISSLEAINIAMTR